MKTPARFEWLRQALFWTALLYVGLPVAAVVAQEAPNLILINLDDADAAILNDANVSSRYPHMQRLAAEGMRFTNLHVTTPLCGPSRASLLRCQYAHRTGIRINRPGSELGNGFDGGMRSYFDAGFFHDDLSVWMQDAGYRTMMVGKFLHEDFLPYVPPGWDDFHVSRGGRYHGTSRFTNRDDPNGAMEQLAETQYRTHVETADAVRLISEHSWAGDESPFFLYLNPYAPHQASKNEPQGMSEQRYRHWWTRAQVFRLPHFNELDVSDKTPPLSELPLLGDAQVGFLDAYYADRLRSLRSVDDMLGQLFLVLEQTGQLDNTYIFLTSDNGFAMGHHRLYGKGPPLDRITRVPLLVWGPGVPTGARANHLLAHIDVTATLVELAGAELPGFADGQSFQPLLVQPEAHEPATWREPVLIQTWEAMRPLGGQSPVNLSATAMRRYDDLYIEWSSGTAEYYEFDIDPLQLNNFWPNLTVPEKIELELQLRSLKRPFMEPLPTISHPVVDGQLLPRRFWLRGMAEDDFGVRRVRLAVRDATSGDYWDGQQWQAEFRQLDCSLTNPGGQLTQWEHELRLPQPDTSELPLQVWVWAYDVSNRWNGFGVSRQLRVDGEGPEVTLHEPAKLAVVSRPVSIAGTASDNLSVDEVQLVIRDFQTGKYWNGNALLNHWTYVVAPITADGQWQLETDLPPGKYVVIVRALDDSRNLSAERPRRIFFVE